MPPGHAGLTRAGVSRPRLRPLTVWAPRARSVELVSSDARVALRPSEGGHHELLDGSIDLTRDYWLALDGGRRGQHSQR